MIEVRCESVNTSLPFQTEGEAAGMFLPPRLYINAVLIRGQMDERDRAGSDVNIHDLLLLLLTII